MSFNKTGIVVKQGISHLDCKGLFLHNDLKKNYMKCQFVKWMLILILIVPGISIIAQNNDSKQQRQEVKNLMLRDDYEKASQIILQLLKDKPNDKELNYNLGICYLMMNDKEKESITLLESATADFPMRKKKNTTAIEARFYLGQAYHLNYQFDKALETFENLKKSITPQQKELLVKIDHEIQYSKNAIEFSQHPVQFKITNLGKGINTPYDEHSPVVSADESVLIFTSNRKGTGDYKTPDEVYYEDLYISDYRSNHWTEAENMGSVVNNEGNNASISLSADGKTLFIYQHDGISGDIYQSELTFNGWTKPEKLPKPINTQYSETHASLSADGNTIFFSSDRPGGFGKSDIYMVRKLPNGEFGPVINLGPAINTEGDEESPFIHPDGKTLYFSSTEHNSMGGFDIFKSELGDSAQWSMPVNIGFPINTPDDDLFYLPTANGLRVYFASRRAGGEGRSDIYLIEFTDEDPRSLSVVAGYIFDKEMHPFGDVTITLVDKESGETVGYYRPNAATGKYVMIVPAGRTFQATYTSEYGIQTKDVDVSSRSSYSGGNWATYLEAVIIDNSTK
jgi:tetratricopeptide (TPR) repeat protein